MSSTHGSRSGFTVGEQPNRHPQKVTVTFEKGGAKYSYTEDAFWQERSRQKPFSDDPIYTYEVEVKPGDHFVIRDREYVFRGTDGLTSRTFLFRPVEDGEEVDYTDYSRYMTMSREDFTNGFGSKGDIFFECRRIDPDASPPAPSRALSAVRRVVAGLMPSGE